MNAAILKLLKNLDVVPLLVGIKDAAVLVWLLAEEADSVFDQDCLISLLQLVIDYYMEDYRPSSGMRETRESALIERIQMSKTYVEYTKSNPNRGKGKRLSGNRFESQRNSGFSLKALSNDDYFQFSRI